MDYSNASCYNTHFVCSYSCIYAKQYISAFWQVPQLCRFFQRKMKYCFFSLSKTLTLCSAICVICHSRTCLISQFLQNSLATWSITCGRRLWWRPVKVLIHYTFFKTNFHGLSILLPAVVHKQCFMWLNCYVRIVGPMETSQLFNHRSFGWTASPSKKKPTFSIKDLFR
jgi:hypothetical protein